MPPKRSPKKKGKIQKEKTPEENEWSEKENMEILNKLLNELRSEKEMRELITRENKETLDEVNRLDRTLNTEKARHEEEAALVLGEKQQDITVLHHEISIVKLEIDKYLVELDGFEQLAVHHEVLKKEYTNVLNEIEEESSRHAEEVIRINQEKTEHRRQLERNFRRTLIQTECTVMEKAFDALPSQSKKQLLGNAKLEEELSLQELGEKHLTKQTSTRHQELKRLNGEVKNMHEKFNERSKKIVQIKRNMTNTESYIVGLDRSIEELGQQRSELLRETSASEKKMPAAQLLNRREALNDELYQASQVEEKWKRRLRDAQARLKNSDTRTLATGESSVVDLISKWEAEDKNDSGGGRLEEGGRVLTASLSLNMSGLLLRTPATLPRKSRTMLSKDLVRSATATSSNNGISRGGGRLPSAASLTRASSSRKPFPLVLQTAQAKALRLLSELPSSHRRPITRI
eukprot:CAMPEP_0185752792 /NCGR_PEP_ID=MMETSP1174-20130828/11568_1 /TAXON_ID=35687 /ORGANISM="Dictyocha speculum, Strain CCMP1381" /LENGTH=460 /DNA_ID=CAMNT_0028430375 /DNA_START=172 /DNA_END=1554 /DNA_ORIENTATION=+